MLRVAEIIFLETRIQSKAMKIRSMETKTRLQEI